jgi:hypothetical protein
MNCVIAVISDKENARCARSSKGQVSRGEVSVSFPKLELHVGAKVGASDGVKLFQSTVAKLWHLHDFQGTNANGTKGAVSDRFREHEHPQRLARRHTVPNISSGREKWSPNNGFHALDSKIVTNSTVA